MNLKWLRLSLIKAPFIAYLIELFLLVESLIIYMPRPHFQRRRKRSVGKKALEGN